MVRGDGLWKVKIPETPSPRPGIELRLLSLYNHQALFLYHCMSDEHVQVLGLYEIAM